LTASRIGRILELEEESKRARLSASFNEDAIIDLSAVWQIAIGGSPYRTSTHDGRLPASLADWL
jgi:hypothetical protein